MASTSTKSTTKTGTDDADRLARLEAEAAELRAAEDHKAEVERQAEEARQAARDAAEPRWWTDRRKEVSAAVRGRHKAAEQAFAEAVRTGTDVFAKWLELQVVRRTVWEETSAPGRAERTRQRKLADAQEAQRRHLAAEGQLLASLRRMLSEPSEVADWRRRLAALNEARSAYEGKTFPADTEPCTEAELTPHARRPPTLGAGNEAERMRTVEPFQVAYDRAIQQLVDEAAAQAKADRDQACEAWLDKAVSS